MPDAGLPQLLVAEAVSAAGAAAGVLCSVSGDRLMELTWVHEHPAREGNGGASSAADLPLALGIATTVSRPVWLTSQAELVRRFPRLAGLAASGEQACAVLPLRADGGRLGAIAMMFAGQHEFAAPEREYLMSLADLCAVSLWQRSRPAGPPRPELSAARLEELVEALTRTESADSVATVIAERGAAGGRLVRQCRRPGPGHGRVRPHVPLVRPAGRNSRSDTPSSRPTGRPRWAPCCSPRARCGCPR